MDKQFLYFLEALHQIDKKYFRYDNYSNKEPSFLTLLKWGQLYVEWNKDHLEKLKELRVELAAIGLDVKEITELSYGYVLVAKLPKNPVSQLLYEQT